MGRKEPGRSSSLRSLLVPGAAVVVPGVSAALAARVVADQGFETLYISGAGLANSALGVPDNGLVTLTELVEVVSAVREIYTGHMIVDADTGFGNAVNTIRTVRMLERAGANAIQLEDQIFPKRCGHFEGKAVIAQAEMVGKIKAALDTRRNADLLVIARTDAIATDGFEAAIARAAAYREAGADITFIEAPQSREQIEAIPKRLPWPQVINIVIGGQTPELSNAVLKEAGYALVLYANVALQASLLGMQRAIGHLREHGAMGAEGNKLVATFAERQRIVDKQKFDELEIKYSSGR